VIRKNKPDLVLLLLCNGYRLDLEGDNDGSVLDEALVIGAFEVLELLLKWGADASKVSTENVVDTYTTDLIDRFWRAGVDYTDDPAFVTYLAHTVNKPQGAATCHRPHVLRNGELRLAGDRGAGSTLAGKSGILREMPDRTDQGSLRARGRLTRCGRSSLLP